MIYKVDFEGQACKQIKEKAESYQYDLKSVLKGIKRDEWGKMQDLASKCFQSCGLNYVRGEKKETKEKDHLERRLFISNGKKSNQRY